MSIQRAFAGHRTVMRASERLVPVLEHAAGMLQACLRSGHKLLACGNGGSAAAAQHFVAELVCRFQGERRALAAVALTADTATLTAIGNDYGYARVFARQIEAIARPGDVLAAFSTSGHSANVIEAARSAQAAGCRIIAFTGMDGGELAPLADLAIRVPSGVVSRIQEVHDVCIHALAESLEDALLQEPGT